MSIPDTRPLYRRPLIFGSVFVMVLFLSGIVTALLYLNKNLNHTARELAKRVASIESLSQESSVAARQSLAAISTNVDRQTALEAKLTDFQNQQAALEQLYQELSRGQDDWILLEVEQTVVLAAQQLQLAGNLPAAIAALQIADGRLARLDRPQYVAIRRAISKDLAQLKAMPAVDIAGTVLRMDQLIDELDRLALLSTTKSNETAKSLALSPAASSGASLVSSKASTDSMVLEHLKVWWDQLIKDATKELHQLIKIRYVSIPEALLITPEQGELLRENLKLRLLNARLAMLTHQPQVFQHDVASVDNTVNRYFDIKDSQTRDFIQQLRSLKEAVVTMDLPDLYDSLSILRTVRSKREAVPVGSSR